MSKLRRRPNRKTQQRFRPPRGAPKGSAKPPTSFTYTYGAETLRSIGPVFVAVWSVPSSVEQKLRDSGQLIPSPKTGLLLLDTGATLTCISQAAAQTLQLPLTRIAKGHGSGGQHESPVYRARLNIRIQSPESQIKTEMTWEQEVMGITELEKPYEVHGIKLGPYPQEVVGLLGRDILRHARFGYDGIAGTLKIDFDLSTFPHRLK